MSLWDGNSDGRMGPGHLLYQSREGYPRRPPWPNQARNNMFVGAGLSGCEIKIGVKKSVFEKMVFV